jgi:16S rRNA processing protein RimM
MIQISEIFPVGQMLKPHGISGELSFSFTSDVFDRENVEFFIMDIDGIFVPFYILEYRFKGSKTGLVKLEGVTSDQEALPLAGQTIYLSKQFIDNVESSEIDGDYFIGFTIIDMNNDLKIGEIVEIDQTTENVLFVVHNDEYEHLIPASQEYIKKIDHDYKLIYVDLPDGLLDL